LLPSACGCYRLRFAVACLPWREILTAAWFGPKGFASVLGLLILQSGLYREAHIIGIAVLASIVVYSSTDFFVGRWYAQRGRPNVREPQAA
jgi:NhaP-type Na+/H+ or K+/H+ antiporter